MADDFDNDYEPPTKEFIRNSLSYGLKADCLDSLQSMKTQRLQTSNPIPLYMLTNKGKLVKTLITSAYKNKRRILSLPIVGKFALLVKNRLEERNLKSMVAYHSSLDLSHIMALEVDDFIDQLYREALGRPPELAGKLNYKQALMDGASKEVIIYLVCTSKEFGGRAQVVHFDQYQKSYQRYRLKQSLRHIPVLNKLLFLNRDPESLRNQLITLNAKLDTMAKALSSAMEMTNNKLEKNSSMLMAAIDRNKPLFYSFPGGVSVVQMKDYIFGVPSEEWRLALFLNTYGGFEPGTEKYFRSLLREGLNVLDIGANLGIYTLHALAAGCYVYSYEPTPKIFSILSDNVGINGFEPSGRAKLYNLAVSDVEDEVEFSVYDRTSGHNSFYASEASDRKIKVKAICLDHHLSHLNHVDVVKIDVEGAEPLVLRGMEKIIRNNPAIKIIMEFSPMMLKRGGHDPLEFLSAIHGLGLDVFVINEEAVTGIGIGELRKTSEAELCAAYSVNLLLTRSA